MVIKEKPKIKKGVFFSIDALIAVALILSAVVMFSYLYFEQDEIVQPVYFSSDLVNILSTIKLSEFQDPETLAFISDNNITELNRTILEQVLIYRVENEEEKANELLNITLEGLTPSNYNLGVWVEGYNDAIYKTSSSQDLNLVSSKHLISGIEKNKTIEGKTSRVLLSNINERTSSEFVYFGGYIGDGNITQLVILPEDIDSVNYVFMELDAGSDFNLYINDVFSGTYNITNNNFTADAWYINESYLNNFNSGNNTMKFNFLDSNSGYIGGGYIKINYVSSEFKTYDHGIHKKYLSGIEGIVNLYDSFYIPGMLNEMSLFIHYNSDYDLFLTIGNNSIFNETNSTEEIVFLNNTELSSLLNYSELSEKTIPLRFGIAMSPEGEGKGGEADIVLITDLSGSMEYRMDSDITGTARDCEDPNLYDESTKRISIAKCLDKLFVESILNNTNHRVALSAFYGDETHPYKGRVYEESLTTNATYLLEKIDEYVPRGGTCLCCAINDAYKILAEEGTSLRKKYIIVMSDGIPTHRCEAASGCEGTRTGLPGKEGLWLGGACYGGLDDCGSVEAESDCVCASENAIWSSCRANNDLNATINSIGFGPVESCYIANKTLKDTADCGNGEYFASENATRLREIYQNMSEDIINIGYEQQTAYATGNISDTVLFHDSYIDFSYIPTAPATIFNLIPVTVESPIFNNSISQGNFEVPSGITVYEARVTSYSGEKWTDKAFITNSNYTDKSFYNLSFYNEDYYILGDPYVVNIPVNYIQEGVNTIRVGTGLDSENTSGGSPQDKVIYSVGIPLEINYTGIFGKAEGCSWSLLFEDGTSDLIDIPTEYSGNESCIFNENTSCNIDYADDAIDNSICNLFEQLDFDGDGKLFVKFGANDLKIETLSVGKIPYMWGPTVVEVRVW